MTRSEFTTLAWKAQDKERELSGLKDRIEPLQRRQTELAVEIHDLKASMETYLEQHAPDMIVKVYDSLYWLDDVAGVCSQEILEAWSLPDDEPEEQTAAEPVLTDEDLSELAFQQAVRDFASGEDSDVDASTIAGVIVP